MTGVDARKRLEDAPFSYRATKEGRVMFYWQGKHVKTIAGGEAQKFLRRIEGLDDVDAQLVMAKATGHFRHGNERRSGRGDASH